MECGSKDCKAEATERVFWPGSKPLPACGPCKDRALGVAQAMGFYLATEPLSQESDYDP